jgi:hypothetical protein
LKVLTLWKKKCASGSGWSVARKQGDISERKFFDVSLLLPDGTRVWLNARITLGYPVSFSSRERSVELNGEVYFEVAEDAKRPFTVHTDKGLVAALATAFNVKDYASEDKFVATLMSGSVKITPKNRSASFVLASGRKAMDGRFFAGYDHGREADAVHVVNHHLPEDTPSPLPFPRLIPSNSQKIFRAFSTPPFYPEKVYQKNVRFPATPPRLTLWPGGY